MQQQQQETSDSIEVLIRIRPFSEREKLEEARSCFKIDSHSKNTLIFEATTKSEAKYFTFDHVCTEHINQEEIFRIIGIPTASSCLQGYNGCIFAYGQTGAGKTYTIQGPGLDISFNNSLNPEENDKRGILPRVVEYMFSNIESAHDTSSNVVYSVKCNFLEIYNEHIIDLLNPSTKSLQIREDVRKGIYIEGLTEEKCTHAFDTLELVKKGNRSRHIGATNMNIESSRSHSVFTLVIEAKISKDGVTNTRRSRFSFVDLAGSERQKVSNTMGDRLKEGCLINKSLMVLANVINSLVDISEGKSRFVHYRDSKLTFLLKDSLGGNSKTSIIANISPAISSYGETLSTLKFAQRAKLIKNKVRINEETSGTLQSLKSEILRLRQELSNMRNLINIGGIRYSEEKRDLRKSSLELGPIPEFDTNLMQEDMPWSTEEMDPRESQKSHDLELLLKQSLDVLTESETHLLNELSKKDDIIERLKSGREVANDTELNMKMVIKLLTDKVDRFKAMLEKKILSKEDCIDIISDEERSELKTKLLQVLGEPQYESSRDQSKELFELKEENNRLREEYVHLMDILTKQEEQITKICMEHQSKIEEEVKAPNEKETFEDEKSTAHNEEIARMREEYEQMIQEYEKVIYEMEAKNSETAALKEMLQKHEVEKSVIAEEIETLSKAFEEKTKQEYDERLKAFVEEQEKVLEQFNVDFLQVKNERDSLQNNNTLLQAQVQELEQKCKDLTIERESLSDRIVYHKEVEEKLNQEIQGINEKLFELTNQNTQGQSKVEELSNIIIKLQDNLNLAEEQSKMLKEENEKRTIEFENLTKNLEEKIKEFEELRKNYEKSEENCFDKDLEIGELKTLYETSQNNLNGKINELNMVQAECEDLRKEIESKKEEALCLGEKIGNTSQEYNAKVQELEEIKDQNITLQNDFSMKEQEIIRLTEFSEKLNNEIQIKDEEIVSLNNEYKRLSDIGEGIAQQRDIFKAENDKLNEENSKKDDEINLIKEEYNKLQEIYQVQAQSVERMQEESQSLMRQNTEMNNEVNNLKTEYDKLKEEYDLKMQEIQVINEQLKVLETDLQGKEKGILEWTNNYIELKNELQSREYEFEQINKAKAELQSKYEEKSQDLEQLKSNYSDLEKEYNNKASQFGDLLKDYEATNQKLSEKEHDLISLREEFEKYKEGFVNVEQGASSLRSENETLKQENLDKQLEIDSLKLLQEELQNSLLLHKESIESLRKEYDEIKSSFMEKEQQCEALQREYDSSLNLAQERQNEINSLKEGYESIKNNYENLESKYQSIKQERENVINQYEELLQANASHENEAGSLRKLLENFEQEKDILLKETEDAKQNERKLKDEMKRYMQTVGKLKLDFENANNELTNRDEKITQLNEEIIQLNKEMTIVKEELNQSEIREKDKESQLQSNLKEIEQMQNQIAIYEKEQIKYEKDYETFSAERNMFEKMEESLREQIQKLSRRSEKLTEDHNQNRSRFKEEMKALETENAKLTEDLSIKEEEIVRLTEDIGKITKEKEILSNQIKEKSIKESKLLEENQLFSEDLSQVKEQWRQTVHDLETKNLELTEKNEKLLGEINSKEEIIKSIKEEYENIVQKKEAVENDIEELHSELEQANITIKKFESINMENERRQQAMKDEHQRLKQESELLKNELAGKNKGLLQMKEHQNNLVTQIDQLSRESEYYKEKVAKLEKELKEEMTKMYEQREKDINEVTEQYLRLTQEHKSLMKTISLRDEQLAKLKEEFQAVLGEKDKLQHELQSSKASEEKLRQDNQEQADKITRLTSDQYILLKELDVLNQANDTLGGHNNMGQKIRHLNKLKEENNKLKYEKVRAVDDLAKALEQRDKLQKKLDDLQGKMERSDSRSFFDSNRETLNNSRIEQERKSLHSQSFSSSENLSRISSLINSTLSKEDAKFVNAKSNDIDSVLNGVQALTMLIMEKNKTIHNKVTELESVVLKNSILEKEILLMKQKMYIPSSNPATSTSMTSVSALSEINNSKRLHQPPLEHRERARLPFPNKSIGDNQSFHKSIEQKLNSIVNNRSTSLKKGELKLSSDENYLGNSFDFQVNPRIKPVSVKKNLMKTTIFKRKTNLPFQ